MNETRKTGKGSIFAALGPGILFAGAAIGVSHLVQSTRAGAGWGFDLLWVVLLIMICKYPFFQFAHRYTVATGQSLLQGYRQLGSWALGLFMLVVVVSSFITLAAVTIVTAGLAGTLLGLEISLVVLSLWLLLIVAGILGLGHYRFLDTGMKVMVVILATLTVAAVAVAAGHGPAGDTSWPRPDLWTVTGLSFLLALMGWMPAPLDVGVWPSLWILEKHRGKKSLPTMRQVMMDFHLGYIGTGVLAVAFVSFGALLMFGTGKEFSPSGLAFSRQLVEMYTETLGGWSRWIIALVAFITMFSTTLTVLDGYARTLGGGFALLRGRSAVADSRSYLLFMPLLIGIALAVITFFMGSMKVLVDLATIMAFLTAPLVAMLNFKVVRSAQVPKEHRPGRALSALSWVGIVFLSGFSLFWIWLRWLA
ncbi:MAG: divalent metal cation transporter [Gemmatimonadales bacterium]|nr:divalent metal cation transporter [Gemmatimonadales bacterium]